MPCDPSRTTISQHSKIKIKITNMDQKLVLVYVFLVLGSAITCRATTYMVGDNSGWDISTNLDSWAKDKIFNVGDVLGEYIKFSCHTCILSTISLISLNWSFLYNSLHKTTLI